MSYLSVTNLSFLAVALYFHRVGTRMYDLFNPNITPNPPDTPLLRPLWETTQQFDVAVYVSASRYRGNVQSETWRQNHLVLQETNISITETREWTTSVPTAEIRDKSNNASLFVHVYFYKHGLGHIPGTRDEDVTAVCDVQALTKFMSFQENATRHLLGNDEAVADDTWLPTEPEDTKEVAFGTPGTERTVAFYKKRLPLKILNTDLLFPYNNLPGDVFNRMRYNAQKQEYGPLAMIDYNWIRSTDYVVLNITTTQLPLTVSYSPISLGFFRVSNQMSQSLAILGELGGGADETETDQLKEMFSDTNPVLLATTLVVSVFHMLFDFLAFKSDVQFWNERKTYAGLSGRTLLLNLISQSVIFLYLMDNDASKIVLISSFVSLLIEAWKIIKIFRVSIGRSKTFSFLPALTLGSITDSEKSTQQHDKAALRYLGVVMAPVILGYGAYSLVYSAHKSWYSWALGTFASAMYVGGFVLMTPQLFINYKLKSVAHLPWRVFVYKALNTFIDDLFAFIITMPTMHRLSVFRDDLVFFIYLYQRWVYPVDKSRIESVDGSLDEGDSGDKPKQESDSDKPKQE